MDREKVRGLLEQFRQGEIDSDEVLNHLSWMPVEDLGFAQVDHHRGIRQGFPEVIFGKGKTPDQIATIVSRLLEHSPNVLVTRTDRAALAAVHTIAPDAIYSEHAGTITVKRDNTQHGKGLIAIVSAGTSDQRVAEEAAMTAEVMGNEIERIYDVGVAGLHRILNARNRLGRARVIICAAGMEGALPSVLGGLVTVPVIAVPTSVGYGASFNGLAALLGMLNSCASNVTVVNIDNGFGAGFVASLINRL
ncbi:MAG TPA: nickel pincer cofactor biosynthesis protein LarB [Blastocatellia bacterium]|nr:nickel pincer cofactor biosynthesis protein LarB [Blastocatellia bacterium]